MPKFWTRLFIRNRHRAPAAANALQGGIELITPSLIAGWAYHPDILLSDVHLLLGPHVIAQARLTQHRADVAEHLQVSGNFGFELDIPADLPLLRINDEPNILALATDGSQRFPLLFIGAPSSTQERLSAALQPEFRGLRGHFDGLSLDGSRVLGWCYKVGERQPARVWLHAADLPPREVICADHRPGMASRGHPEACGFSLALSDWPEAAGSILWVSYDAEGFLRLPQVRPVHLPAREGPSVESGAPTELVQDPATEALSLPGQEGLSWKSGGTSEHWLALESFRRYLDGVERELDRRDALKLRSTRSKGFWARFLGSGH